MASHEHTHVWGHTTELEFVQLAEHKQLKINLISASRYVTGDHYRYKASSFSVVHSDGTKIQRKLQQRIFQLDVMKIFHHKGSQTSESMIQKRCRNSFLGYI